MKITKKSEYALRALVEIGLHNGGRVIRAQDIAEKETLSVKFLEQVLLPLKNRASCRPGVVLPGDIFSTGPRRKLP
jgi:DNA-binding IscR family transcriptional regulator